ncbi:MAG TPA: 3-hydroxyacyl-CoA dehydrogenase family protein [Gemmatimonadales bacterium]|jgi:3-hydroxyacyl-CoA dehydrogenase|nr:3-hydroxyacyl-CoA dehydrogenase family protein [Gemmatimonadales bacterium]
MPDLVPPRVAVLGAGDIGCGWAALAASRGWNVAIYDTDTSALLRAQENIADRTQTLVSLGHADHGAAETGMTQLRMGRSLLQAVTDADWIIEATPEDLASKQRVLEQVEQVSRLKSVLTSCSGLLPSMLCGRLRRPERMLVIHPLNPVELLPAVEVIPSSLSDSACVEDVRFWLTGLGRVVIVLRKEIPGGVLGRISAAVWREAIYLVLEGVVDVVDVDTAIEMGPSLGWAAAGPHLTCHLNARERGVSVFLASLMPTYESWWQNLASWHQLSGEDQLKLAKAIEKAYSSQLPQLRAARDIRLARLLNALSEEEVSSDGTP